MPPQAQAVPREPLGIDGFHLADLDQNGRDGLAPDGEIYT